MDQIARKLEKFIPEATLPYCLKFLLDGSSASPCKDQNKTYSGNPKNVLTPSNLKFLNENAELYDFVKFQDGYSYQIYPSTLLKDDSDLSESKLLIGILDIHPHGWLVLKDHELEVPVKFYKNKYDVNIKNKVVVIKHWIVLAEIFEELNVVPLQYLLVNIEDVKVIENEALAEVPNEKKLFVNSESLNEIKTNQMKIMMFQIVRKSELIIGYNSAPEYWIEALLTMEDSENSFKNIIYAILGDEYLKIAPFLHEDVVYRIHYYENLIPLQISNYKELYKLRTGKKLYRIPKNTIFQEIDDIPLSNKDLYFENFEELRSALQDQKLDRKFFSFSFKISKRKIKDAGIIFTSKRHESLPLFGTPGKNKQLHLAFWNPESKNYIDFYINDFDNHLFPLGLLPDMKILVKHVQSYKKYIKSTVFTSFELLEYCPKIPFSSVNLHFSHRNFWQWQDDPKTLLGLYQFIPSNIIVHGSFLLQAVFDLKIVPICCQCKQSVSEGQICTNCSINGRDITVQMNLYVQDPISPAFSIETDNKYFLFSLLGLKNDLEREYFCNAFFNVGIFEGHFSQGERFTTVTKNEESKEFINQLVQLIKEINFNCFFLVDAVCIKTIYENEFSKPWKLLEFSFVN